MVSVVAANFAETCIECTLFGVFLSLSSASLILLLRRREVSARSRNISMRSRNWRGRVAYTLAALRSPLILANVLYIFTVTGHWIVGMRWFFEAVVNHETTQQATDYLNNLHVGTQFGRLSLLFFDMTLGDIVLAYRTWLVWRCDYRVLALPCITTCGLIVSGIGIVHSFVGPSTGIFDLELQRWIISFCSMTLVNNIYATGMITYKLCSMNMESKRHGLQRANGGNLMGALAIFVESAALCTAWAIFFVVTYLLRSPLQTLGTGCGPVMLGIAFMLITVRVGLGVGQESVFSGVAENATQRSSRTPRFQFARSAFPMQTITLDISSSVEQEVDYSLSQKAGEERVDAHTAQVSR
ncbi:hypothetical protein BD413DRAFT_595966 [Trametes elegans]|nr:hypothetical protein BD413DRAFT_595966 [Trametes elegans]